MCNRNGSVHGTMKSKRTKAVLAVLVVTLSWACAHTEQFHDLVKERAAYDLQCEAGSLAVTELPGMAYGVRGCEQQATYLVTGALCQNPKQLTKREVNIYCTPMLDHTATRAGAAVEPTQEEAPPPSSPEPQHTQSTPQ